MKIIFLDTVHPILEERLIAANHQCIHLTDSDFDSTKKLISVADGIVVRSRFPMDANLLDAAPNLKFIARSGAGMENIDLDYCAKRNIQLFNAPEGNRNAVGEHALGMLLALMNNIFTADAEVRAGKWDRAGNRGIELDGKTVGIIGYGNNGEAFAKKLRGFDVQILAHDKYKSNFGNKFVQESTLEELYANADVISFHIPQNEETLFWANDLFFESIKKPFFLLNLSRGKIVETKALLNAIENGKVLGAGLDVLEFEKASFENFFDGNMPEAFQQLLASKKVILSPHVGGWTNESYFKLSAVLADKILNYFQ
jgi:D-3-phosphoglycerate dehydrogenase